MPPQLLRVIAAVVLFAYLGACTDPETCTGCRVPKAAASAPLEMPPPPPTGSDPTAWYDGKRPAMIAAVASVLVRFDAFPSAAARAGVDADAAAHAIAGLLVRPRDHQTQLAAIAAAQTDGSWTVLKEFMGELSMVPSTEALVMAWLVADPDDATFLATSRDLIGAFRDLVVATLATMSKAELAEFVAAMREHSLLRRAATGSCEIDDPSTWDTCLSDLVEGLSELVDTLVTSLLSPCNPTGRWLMIAGLIGLGVSLGLLIYNGCIRVAVIAIVRWIVPGFGGVGAVADVADLIRRDAGRSSPLCYAYLAGLAASLAIIAWGRSLNRPEDCPTSEHPIVPPLPCAGPQPILSLDGRTVGPELAERPTWLPAAPLSYALDDATMCHRTDLACHRCIDSNTDVCDPDEFIANGGSGLVTMVADAIELHGEMWNLDGAFARSTSNTTYPPYRGQFELAHGVRPGDRYEKLSFTVPFGKWTDGTRSAIAASYHLTASVTDVTGWDWALTEVSWEFAVRRQTTGEVVCLSRIRGIHDRFNDPIEAAGVYTNRDLYLDNAARVSRFGALASRRCVGYPEIPGCAATSPLIDLTCTTGPGVGLPAGKYDFTIRPLLEGRTWDAVARATATVKFPIERQVGATFLSVAINQCD